MPLCFKFTIKKKKKLATLKAQLSILCAVKEPSVSQSLASHVSCFELRITAWEPGEEFFQATLSFIYSTTLLPHPKPGQKAPGQRAGLQKEFLIFPLAIPLSTTVPQSKEFAHSECALPTKSQRLEIRVQQPPGDFHSLLSPSLSLQEAQPYRRTFSLRVSKRPTTAVCRITDYLQAQLLLDGDTSRSGRKRSLATPQVVPSRTCHGQICHVISVRHCGLGSLFNLSQP